MKIKELKIGMKLSLSETEAVVIEIFQYTAFLQVSSRAPFIVTEQKLGEWKEVEEISNYHLMTRLSDTGLDIGFHDDNDLFLLLGEISKNGHCCMLNRGNMRGHRKMWADRGLKISTDRVKLNGKEYFVNTMGVLRSEAEGSEIFSFKLCVYVPDCSDVNILRYPNNTPIPH